MGVRLRPLPAAHTASIPALPRSGVPPMTRAASARWTAVPALVLLALTALDPAPRTG